MISQVSSGMVAVNNLGSLSDVKNTAQKSVTNISKQGDMSKIDKLKESIESGAYEINLQALSEKIAEELL